MKIKNIKETGFYKVEDYNDIVFEVIENTDEKWLEEEPDAKLLLDVWNYDYTDSDDRKHYETEGALYRLDTADYGNVDVEKAEQKYFLPETSINAGCFLVEDKPTYKEIIIKLKEQMKNDITRYENDNYDTNDFICTIRDYLRIIGEKL